MLVCDKNLSTEIIGPNEQRQTSSGNDNVSTLWRFK